MVILGTHYAQVLDLEVHKLHPWVKGVFRRERLRKWCDFSMMNFRGMGAFQNFLDTHVNSHRFLLKWAPAQARDSEDWSFTQTLLLWESTLIYSIEMKIKSCNSSSYNKYYRWKHPKYKVHCDDLIQSKAGTLSLSLLSFFLHIMHFIDREAREIMHLVASVRLSVRPSVRLFALSRLNCLTHDLHLLHGGQPWPWLGWLCMSRS